MKLVKYGVTVLLAIVISMITLPSASYAYNVDDSYISGGVTTVAYRNWSYNNRIDTASGFAREYSSHIKQKIDGIVVVNGWSPFDVIVASGLAGNLGYALVYVGYDGFGDIAMADIDAMSPASVVVVGGPAVVPDGALSVLSSRSYVASVERVWGANRCDTAAAVYDYGASHGSGWSDTAVLVSGSGFADGASAASLVAYGKMPVVLTSGGSIPPSELNILDGSTAALVVGGESVVPDSLLASLPGEMGSSVIRISGSDRYATSRAVVDYEVNLREPASDGTESHPYGYESMYLVKGTSHADAIAFGANSSIFPWIDIHQIPANFKVNIGRPVVVMSGEGNTTEFANQVRKLEDSGQGGRLGALISDITFTANGFSDAEITDFCNTVCRYRWKFE